MFGTTIIIILIVLIVSFRIWQKKKDIEYENGDSPGNRHGKGGCLTILICLILITIGGFFAYKTLMIDFDGEYASGRLVYTTTEGFCMLITYHPEYRTGNTKGFAVTNIPFITLFTQAAQAHNYCNAAADSKEMLNLYKVLSLGSVVDASIAGIDIGNKGKYFALSENGINKSLENLGIDLSNSNSDFTKRMGSFDN